MRGGGSKGQAGLRVDSIVPVHPSRKAWRPTEDRGVLLPRMRFTSATQASESMSAVVRSLLLGFAVL